MSARSWILIAACGLVLTILFSHFQWFKTNEHVAIWLEGIALVAIFGLDFVERRAQEEERKHQHEETIEELKISRTQAEAAIRAADAAKKSADISAALNRPLVGIQHFQPTTIDINGRYWTFKLTVRNYGTLPAIEVSTAVEFRIDGELRYTHREAESLQIFPSNPVEQDMGFNVGEDERGAIPSGRKKLEVTVTVRYQREDGRKFEYLAKGSYKQQQIDIRSANTYELAS